MVFTIKTNKHEKADNIIKKFLILDREITFFKKACQVFSFRHSIFIERHRMFERVEK